jgi:hypothetical protein
MKNLAFYKKKFNSLVVGCGYSSQRIFCQCDSVVCLDIDKRKLHIAKNGDPHAHYIVGDAQLLPFRKECFYDIICTDVLEHILSYDKVLCGIIELSPKVIYLRFPTEIREKLLINISRIYRIKHWHKIHVVIVDRKKVMKLLENFGYKVNLDVTLGSSTLSRIILHSFLEKLRVNYRIPEIGLVELEKKSISYEVLAHICTFLGFIISLFPFMLWKFFKLRTIHDGYIILATKNNVYDKSKSFYLTVRVRSIIGIIQRIVKRTYL